MTHSDVKICLAGPDDLDQVADLLTTAFLDGDYANWLIPDRSVRERTYPDFFRLVLEPAFDHGQVHVTSDGAAAAIWYFLPEGTPPAPDDYPRRLANILGDATSRFVALDTAFETLHPRDTEHFYLAFLAVRPDRQREGLGSALLAHHHETADTARVACYLEATGDHNARLYQVHGYQPQPPVSLPYEGPAIRPMLRPRRAP